MINAHSKITAQGQVSVPAAVRKALGLTQGAVLEWTEFEGQVTVRRAARHDSQAVHQALFPDGPPGGTLPSADEIKAGIRNLMRKRHARD